MDVGELKTEMDRRFEQVDKRFDALERTVAIEAEATRRHFGALERFIIVEGETTRRYFDVAVERILATSPKSAFVRSL